MILVLSGEGPTDIGARQPRETGWEFVAGPMAWIIDKLLEQKLNYSLLELNANNGNCVYFVNEGELSALRGPKPLFMPRGGQKKRNIFFFKSAFLLGKQSKDVASERNSPVIAVFFRDADRTRSTPMEDWQNKFDSMKDGFEAAEFSSGVPMVPRPKSEAWMLCGLLKRQNAGADCGWLEGASGNDASPNSLKAQLANHLGHEPTTEEQAEFVRSGQIDPEVIDLSSFLAFRAELDRAYVQAAAPLN